MRGGESHSHNNANNRDDFLFTRLSTPSSARATPIDIFDSTYKTRKPALLTIQLTPLKLDADVTSPSPRPTTTQSARTISESKSFHSIRNLKDDLSPLTVIENKRRGTFLSSLYEQQQHSKSLESIHYSASPPTIQSARVFAKFEDSVKFAENPSLNSELVVKECIAVKKQVIRILEGRNTSDVDEISEMQVLPKTVKQRSASPTGKVTAGKYSKSLPRDLQKKLLMKIKDIPKDPKQAKKYFRRASIPVEIPDPQIPTFVTPGSVPSNIIQRNKLSLLKPREKEEKVKQMALTKVERMEEVRSRGEYQEIERVSKHRKRIDDKYSKDLLPRNERIEQYFASIKEKKLYDLVVISKFVFAMEEGLINARSRGRSMPRHLSQPPSDYSPQQIQVFASHKQQIATILSTIPDSAVTRFMSKYVLVLAHYIRLNFIIFSIYIARLRWKIRRRQIAAKMIREALTCWIDLELLVKCVNRFILKIKVIQRTVRKYLEVRRCTLQLLALQFAKEEQRIREERAAIASMESDTRRDPELKQRWIKAKQKIRALQVVSQFATRNRPTSLFNFRYSLIPKDIRERVVFEDYISRKRRYVWSIMQESKQKHVVIVQPDEETPPSTTDKSNTTAATTVQAPLLPPVPILSKQCSNSFIIPTSVTDKKKKRFRILLSKARMRKLVFKAEAASRQRLADLYAKEQAELKSAAQEQQGEVNPEEDKIVEVNTNRNV